jgi:hypothetical protein
MATDSQTYRPKGRSAGLDIEDLNDEIVVYDRTSDQVHLLSASTAKIWRLCDGKRRTVGIVDELEGQEASLIAVDSALSELEAVELLDLSHEAEASRAPVNLSRRSLLTNAACASAVVAASSIVTLRAPLAQELTSVKCVNVNDCIEFCPTAESPPAGECRYVDQNDISCVSEPPAGKFCETVGGAADRPIDLDTCNCKVPD